MIRDYPLDIKTAPSSDRFEGYASTFDIDLYGDAVQPGAFTKSLASFEAAGRYPPCLWSHRIDEPIGAFTRMAEDSRGLAVEGRLAGKGRAAEVRELIELGAVGAMSIGFRTVRESFDKVKGANLLHEITLYEISLVSLPANVAARFSMKSFDTLRDAERLLRDAAGMSRTDAEAFVERVRSLRPAGMADDIDLSALTAHLTRAARIVLPA